MDDNVNRLQLKYCIAVDCVQCGKIKSRVVGGREVKAYSIPWQVGLVNMKGDTPSCGGMMIKDDVVLTAAHCIDIDHLDDICRTSGRCTSTPMYVVSKVHNFRSQNIPDENYHKICHVEKHPRWNSRTFDYDFALLYLQSPITCWDGRANIVCLPYRSRKFSDKYLGRRKKVLRVSGWGLKEDETRASGLRSVKQIAMTNRECNHVFKNKSIKIHRNMLCAGAENQSGKDACQGDSGGTINMIE
jgi:hypothetical protein